MTLDSLPDLDTSGLCLVKNLSTALTCWPYRNTALRDGARTSTRTSSVAKGRTASIHCRPAPPRQTEALSSRTSRSRPGNVAAKRCVVPDDLERGTRRFRPAVAPEASDSELQLEFDRFPIRPLSISAGTDLLASPGHGLSRADCGEPHTEKV